MYFGCTTNHLKGRLRSHAHLPSKAIGGPHLIQSYGEKTVRDSSDSGTEPFARAIVTLPATRRPGRSAGDQFSVQDQGDSPATTRALCPAASRPRRCGIIDATHAWPGYRAGKNSAAGLFAPGPAGPYGMDREEYLGWLYAGGGLELYSEMLQKELKMNVVVAGFTTSLPYWEPLGWFKKPFKTLTSCARCGSAPQAWEWR